MKFLNFIFNLQHDNKLVFNILCILWLLSLITCVIKLGLFIGLIANVILSTVVTVLGSNAYSFIKGLIRRK